MFALSLGFHFHVLTLPFFFPSLLHSHYVAFVRKNLPAGGSAAAKPIWVLFNDEKVVEAVDFDEMKKFAYVYFFQRV